jgi:hypothetical protein
LSDATGTPSISNASASYDCPVPEQLARDPFPGIRPLSGRPGRERSERIAQEGLARLERQLRAGAKMSSQVLEQWVQRYGDAARELIERYRRPGR